MSLHEILDDTMRSWARERPDLDLAAMGTVLRMGQLMNVALRSIDDVFAPHGINLGEFDVIAALRRSGRGSELTPTVLARVAMVSPGGMTNRLDRLERAGLIERKADANDRRGSRVSLTAQGEDVADRAVEDLVRAENEWLSFLSATERARLDRTLDKLIDRLAPAE